MSNQPSELSRQAADAVNRFQLDLFSRFPESENLVFSPFGFYLMLAILHEGARGKTRTVLSGLLGHHDPETSVMPGLKSLLGEFYSRTELTAAEKRMVEEQEEYRNDLVAQGQWNEDIARLYGAATAQDISLDLSIASGMWLQDTYGCKSEFIETIRSEMAVEVGHLDFEGDPVHSCQAINEWVDKGTRGRIKEVISPADLPSLCRLILANTTHFKARWEHEFSAPQTGIFHLLDGTNIETPMMTGKFWGLNYVQTNSFLAVELPYYRRPVSMVVTMPVQYGQEALLEFKRQSEHYWHDVQLEIPTKYQKVTFTMPEFKIAASHELSSRLSEPETHSIFGQTADFSGISDEVGFRVTRILQSTYIVADQHGTEAAAATLGMTLGALLPEEEVTLTIDHPFIFAIVDKPTGVVLFAGKAMNPTESG